MQKCIISLTSVELDKVPFTEWLLLTLLLHNPRPQGHFDRGEGSLTYFVGGDVGEVVAAAYNMKEFHQKKIILTCIIYHDR